MSIHPNNYPELIDTIEAYRRAEQCKAAANRLVDEYTKRVINCLSYQGKKIYYDGFIYWFTKKPDNSWDPPVYELHVEKADFQVVEREREAVIQ